jgi:hypothetical protein
LLAPCCGRLSELPSTAAEAELAGSKPLRRAARFPSTFSLIISAGELREA